MVVSASILQDGLTREAGVDELTDDFGSDHAQIATRVDFGRILGCVEHTGKLFRERRRVL